MGTIAFIQQGRQGRLPVCPDTERVRAEKGAAEG